MSNRATMEAAARRLEDVLVAGAIETTVRLVEANNSGRGSAPPAPIDTGELRGSVRITVNEIDTEESREDGPFPLTLPADVRRSLQLGGFTAGDVAYARFRAAHANIIEGGRRPDKNGRMIGSEQAPQGWVALGIEEVVDSMSGWTYTGVEELSG